MKKLTLLLPFLLPLLLAGQPQNAISIEECYNAAINNHPIQGKKELISRANEYAISNLQTANLPRLNWNMQATYQSDVTHVDFDFPGAPSITAPKDQYRIALDIAQPIYNGGKAKVLEKMANSETQYKLQEVEADYFKTKLQVNDLYFKILTLKIKIQALDTMMTDINLKLKIIKSAIQNGILLPANESILQAEALKLKQTKAELSTSVLSLLNTLSLMTGIDLDENTHLEVPQVGNRDTTNYRPETELFNLNKTTIDSKSEVALTQKLPTVQAFVQLGYGQPGLNMLSESFDPYYLAGIKFSWRLTNWGLIKNEININSINKDLINKQHDYFNQLIAIQQATTNTEIAKYESLIESDNEIIAIQKMITAQYASQLQNGIITSSDYLTQLHAETQAILNREIHQLLLVETKIKYMANLGQFIQ